ncbi:hypothetical protein ACRALDRAFT_211707 [Sodiomyces alcalophilus JCM 7366]|uniref:uncharacterized protein n=1 Tax=Sodiomyces alcalophilus JCM 7366 TaxID=591952 RepID=UPI0039B38159
MRQECGCRTANEARRLILLQGAKAQQKRERNQKDVKVAKSQLKAVRSSRSPRNKRTHCALFPYSNVAAKDIQCVVCKATFLKTTKAPALTEHAENKHRKTLAESARLAEFAAQLSYPATAYGIGYGS